MRLYRLFIFCFCCAQLQACSFFVRPELSLRALKQVDPETTQAINQEFATRLKKTKRVSALLKIRAQKLTAVQEISAAFVYSNPSQARISLFATQFNRLFALIVANGSMLNVYLPDDNVMLVGKPTARAMQVTLGIPFSVNEFAAWLFGLLPEAPKGRTIFWDSSRDRYVSEQQLHVGHVLRSSFVRLASGELQVVAIELIEGGKPIFYSSILWHQGVSHPSSHAIELSRESVSLEIELSKVSISSEGFGADENAKVFRVPNVPRARRIPIESLEGTNSILSPH